MCALAGVDANWVIGESGACEILAKPTAVAHQSSENQAASKTILSDECAAAPGTTATDASAIAAIESCPSQIEKDTAISDEEREKHDVIVDSMSQKIPLSSLTSGHLTARRPSLTPDN